MNSRKFFDDLGSYFLFLGMLATSVLVLKYLTETPQASQETKTAMHNPPFITPEPNQPIEIGKVGNRTFFLANLDGKECISVIALNMSSYFICGDEPKLNK